MTRNVIEVYTIQACLLQKSENSCIWLSFDITCIFVGMKSTPFQVKIDKLVKHTDRSIYIYTRKLKRVDKNVITVVFYIKIMFLSISQL